MKIRKAHIKKLIRLKSWKQKEVAEQIGVSTQDWNNWMFRGVFPHYDKLEELAELLEVPVDELILEEEIEEGEQSYKNGNTQAFQNGTPFFDINSASALAILQGEAEDYTPDDFSYIPGLSADLMLSYYGKEMTPVIASGDLIALREIKDRSFFSYGNIYLITTTEQVLLRYIHPGNTNNTLRLKAYDEQYEEIELSLRKIKSIHLLVGTVKREAI